MRRTIEYQSLSTIIIGSCNHPVKLLPPLAFALSSVDLAMASTVRTLTFMLTVDREDPHKQRATPIEGRMSLQMTSMLESRRIRG